MLECALEQKVQVVSLQETRHHSQAVPWAHKCAAGFGFQLSFSVPSPLDAQGRRTPGGTALLWRKGAGKVASFPCRCSERELHRSCLASWENFTVCSAYGPAQKPDVSWFRSVVQAGTDAKHPPCVFLGDFNWKPVYDSCVPLSWHTASPLTCTVAGTAPTRAIASVPIEPVLATPLPGIPFHFGVVFKCRVVGPPPLQQPTRLHRCASFRWLQAKPPAHKLLAVKNTLDATCPSQPDTSDLVASWKNWHHRAETAFHLCVANGLATLDRKAERPKGSLPSSRPTAPGPSHRPPQPVAHRRLLKVHRAVAEGIRHGCSHDALDGPLLSRVQRVLWECYDHFSFTAGSFSDALLALDQAITAQAQLVSKCNAADWKAAFRSFATSTASASEWKLARTTLKPSILQAAFTAPEMRESWAKVWAPPGFSAQPACDAWRQLAREAGIAVSSATEVDPEGFLPDRQLFSEAMLHCSGSEGFDGWTSAELHAMEKHLPFLATELFELWCHTTLAAGNSELPLQLSDMLWSWRVAGIPKRSPYESRPISVGSCLLRVWHKALLRRCPPPPSGQWCGRQNTSVVHATANYLASRPCAVAETDLSKAFDSLAPEVASVALQASGVPPCVCNYLRQAWRGPRVCYVSGELAAPIRPLRGIPQGDPISPLALSSCLGPWNTLVQALDPDLSTWAFMDDRTIAVIRQGNKQLLHLALNTTRRFDRALGFEINPSKTQIWVSGDRNSNRNADPRPMEHLGLRHHPGKPGHLIEGRDPDKLKVAIRLLSECPGGFHARVRLATSFLRPLMDWGSPLMKPGDPSLVRPLFKAVCAAKATWWCAGRFYALNVDLHPVLGVALRGLAFASRVLPDASPHVHALLEAHAQALHLRIVGFNHQAVTVQSLQPDFPPTPVPAERFNQPVQVHGDRVLHLLRMRARRLALAAVPATRLDRQGIELIDLEAASNPRFKRFLTSLSFLEANKLAIYRCGAVRSRTRRFKGADTNCSFCHAPYASARHYFADCPELSAIRSRLEKAHQIPNSWWRAQPRITSKSAWVTTTSGCNPQQRVSRLIATCKLAIAITALCAPE